MPVMLIVVMLVFQVALFWHAKQAADVAAEEAVDAAQLATATEADGYAGADTILGQAGNLRRRPGERHPRPRQRRRHRNRHRPGTVDHPVRVVERVGASPGLDRAVHPGGRAMSGRQRWRNDERGSVATEFAIVMAAILLGLRRARHLRRPGRAGRERRPQRRPRSRPSRQPRRQPRSRRRRGTNRCHREPAPAPACRARPRPITVDLSRFEPGGEVTVDHHLHARRSPTSAASASPDSRAFTRVGHRSDRPYRGVAPLTDRTRRARRGAAIGARPRSCSPCSASRC